MAAAGLVAWRVTGDPGLATLAAVAADAIAAVPTVRHTLRAPHEESWLFYSSGGASAAIGLLTLERWTVATAGFSVYLVVLCSALVALILTGQRRSNAAL